MSAVRACHAATKMLYDLIRIPVEDEDERIAEIEQLLAEREAVLLDIKPPFSQEEQQLGQEMVQWNKSIDAYLKKVKYDIQRNITGLTKKKDSVEKYVNPYSSVLPDGMFYDKRN